MNQIAQKNNDFWSKIPHGLDEDWCGSRESFKKIVTALSEHVNRDGELHFSARKVANKVGIHVSNVSRFLLKGRRRGLWLYKFDEEKNLSYLKFVGGIFTNLYTQAQHLVKAVGRLIERSFPKRTNPLKYSATPTQHLTQHPSDPDKRAENLRLVELIKERSLKAAIANATPSATQI